MTVNNQTSKITYTANGSTTVWSFPFAADAPSSVFLFITDSIGNITQVATDQYTVSLNTPVDPNPTSQGGSVTYPLSGPPLATGNTLTVARFTPDLQLTSISNQSIVYPPVIERQFDYRTMIDQQLMEVIDRSVKVGIGDVPMAPLPPKALRINLQALFDINGNLTAGGIPLGTVISAAMVPVVTAASLPLARTAMGVPPVDSPVFTGDPKAPTAGLNDNDTTIATTAFVQNQLAGVGAQFPSGTQMLFRQTNAPTGWTKDVIHHNYALRVVNGTVGDGGSVPFSTLFGRLATDPFLLSINEMPSHNHAVSDPGHVHNASPSNNFITGSGTLYGLTLGGAGPFGLGDLAPQMNTGLAFTGIGLFNTGGNLPHSHNIDMRVLYVDVIIGVKD